MTLCKANLEMRKDPLTPTFRFKDQLRAAVHER